MTQSAFNDSAVAITGVSSAAANVTATAVSTTGATVYACWHHLAHRENPPLKQTYTAGSKRLSRHLLLRLVSTVEVAAEWKPDMN